MLANLTLSYTPDRPGLFSDDVTPVNMIPVLLNAYAGQARAARPRDQSYLTDLQVLQTGGYFPLERAPEPRLDCAWRSRLASDGRARTIPALAEA